MAEVWSGEECGRQERNEKLREKERRENRGLLKRRDG